MARAVADKLGPRLGQTVVVENKPGASNTLAADLAAKSGDAHTMVMGVSTAMPSPRTCSSWAMTTTAT